MEQIKFDLHTNVGFIPKTKKKSSQELHITPEKLADFLNKFKITHNVVLYSDYAELEELDRLTPNTKLYGLKWVNDVNGSIEDNSLLDIGKPLWAGLKFHSHRCFRVDKKTGEREYGLDYSDHTTIGKILEILPDNTIINMHTQGSASLHNQASPRAIYSLALKYPNIKFIISHMGAYGKGSFQPNPKYYPVVKFSEQSKEQKMHNSLLKIADFSQMLVNDAAYLVDRLENLYLNTSVLYPLKREALKITDKWGIGSDFPFTHTTPQNWEEHSYDIQVKLATNYVGAEKVEASHRKTLDWIERDITMPRDKKWIAFFSRTGSEILKLSKEIGRSPDIIITNKSAESVKKSDIYIQLTGKSKFYQLPEDPKSGDYTNFFQTVDLIPGWDIITLHGFLKIVPSRIVKKYPMVNLHPGLITKYPELKGLHPQKRVWRDATKYDKIGCILHHVIPAVDEGEVIDTIEEDWDWSMYQEKHLFDALGRMALKLWKDYLTKQFIK